METNINKNSNTQYYFKKFSLFLVFALMLLLNESCQFKPATQFNIVIQDMIRKAHASELLSKKSNNNKVISSFNGDENFYQYIKEYLKKNNDKIDAEKFTQSLLSVSQEQAYDPIFLLAVIKTESGFNFNAIGSAGEIGLMQIKPDTAEWICNLKNIEWKGAEALKNPEYNILVGAYYFKYLKKAVKSQSIKYVNAYNMGLTMMKRLPSSDLKKHPYFGKVKENYLAIYSELQKIKEKKSI